jgi:hypothetical protein
VDHTNHHFPAVDRVTRSAHAQPNRALGTDRRHHLTIFPFWTWVLIASFVMLLRRLEPHHQAAPARSPAQAD